jgi:hypothetical protein
MTKGQPGRIAGASGALFVVLLGLALFLPGAPPKANDPTGEIAATLVDKRTEILVGMYIAGLALIALVYFASTVRSWLASSGGDRSEVLATVAFAGALSGVLLAIVGMVLFYGAAYKVAGEGELAIVRALTDAGNAAIEMTKFAFAVFIGAVSIAARNQRLLPDWLTVTGPAMAVILLATAIPLIAEGSFTQFGGGLDLLGAAPAFAWILVLSIVMVRQSSAYASRTTSGTSRSAS